jgi:hypothetical protein
MARRRLAIRQSVGRVYSQVVIHEPKTARARRSIGVDPDTLAAPKAHRGRQRFERKLWADAYADHGLVFCREDGRPFPPEVVNMQFRRHARAAGLPPIRVSEIVESDESGTVRLRVGASAGASHVEGPDEHGVVRLVPVMSHEEIAARLEANAPLAARVAANEADPTRPAWWRDPPRGAEVRFADLATATRTPLRSRDRRG